MRMTEENSYFDFNSGSAAILSRNSARCVSIQMGLPDFSSPNGPRFMVRDFGSGPESDITLGGMRCSIWRGQNVKKEILNDKLWRKLVTGEKVMVAKLWLFKDCMVPLHHHESEQISIVLQGATEV